MAKNQHAEVKIPSVVSTARRKYLLLQPLKKNRSPPSLLRHGDDGGEEHHTGCGSPAALPERLRYKGIPQFFAEVRLGKDKLIISDWRLHDGIYSVRKHYSSRTEAPHLG